MRSPLITYFLGTATPGRTASKKRSARYASGTTAAANPGEVELVPVFARGELSRLERACAGRAFAQRRDLAIIAVFRATGIRLSELARIRYDADDAPDRLWVADFT